MKVHYSSNLLSKDVFEKYFKPSFKINYDCNLDKIDNFYNYIELEHKKIQHNEYLSKNTINYSIITEIGTLILLYIINDFNKLKPDFHVRYGRHLISIINYYISLESKNTFIG